MLSERLALYRRLEASRGRPLIVYVTSPRPGSTGSIAADVVQELLMQLDALPAGTRQLDLLLASYGGDPTVAWRIVSLIREKVERFSALVPQAAYSAATLIALGADEIVMHPHGNLGPTDPQIQAPKRGQKDAQQETIPFGSEDLSAFLKFARDDVGLNDQSQMLSVFNHFCEEVGSVAVGVAARSALLTVTMGEKLLQLHMKADSERQKARAISEKLTRDFFHHGYPVSRTEAVGIGLAIAEQNADIEQLIWGIWLDLSDELRLREPFSALSILSADPNCAPLFAPVPQLQIPGNLPPAVQQQAVQAALQQIPAIQIAPAQFENINAVMESHRVASRFLTKGIILASRQPDLQIKVTALTTRQGWSSIPVQPVALEAGVDVVVAAARKKKPRARRAAG